MNRRVFAVRVYDYTPEIVDSIALQFGCLRIHDGTIKGSAGALLDKIAQGKLQVILSNND